MPWSTGPGHIAHRSPGVNPGFAKIRTSAPPDAISWFSMWPRERETMALVVSGLLTKQIAIELGISEITVKAHRGVMRKMRFDSLADLVRVAAGLDVPLVAHA